MSVRRHFARGKLVLLIFAAMHPKDIRISDFSYLLPDERIALHPLAERDASKLLLYKNGVIAEKQFRDLASEIPADALLVFNNTRVIRARMHFQRETGALIELFCTESVEPFRDFARSLTCGGSVVLRAFVGNGKRWKTGEVLQLEMQAHGKPMLLTAEKIAPVDEQWLVKLSWPDVSFSFAEVLEAVGKIPLPPYLNREEESDDEERYQTIFAQHKGSVAAPTASLHFTPAVLHALQAKGIRTAEVTLHVGAGTFKPVKSELMNDHLMHREQIIISRELVAALIAQKNAPIVAAGTTSLRTLESIYWFGQKLVSQPGRSVADLFVDQWEPYETSAEVPTPIALRAVLDWMTENNKSVLTGETRLLIAPSYKFRIVSGLITNFHQPQSTLLLLVAAFV
ncbi:MAG: S-adenosylmethionine:tRNA ribosyltransferase-isomerase, partial [Bacteroidia bacterium]